MVSNYFILPFSSENSSNSKKQGVETVNYLILSEK